MTTTEQIRALINRLARLDAAETRGEDLNPAQVAALEYLARANRFSRGPSHVADYLGTTRGTMSQTLKVLVRKGYATERRSESDRRSISCEVTEAGRALLERRSGLAQTIGALQVPEQAQLAEGLSAILARRLEANGGRSFGICRGCTYHRKTGDGAYCTLLSVPLAPEETGQLCHEHVAA